MNKIKGELGIKRENFTIALVHLNGTLNMTSAGMHAFLEKQGFRVYSIFFRELNFLGGNPPKPHEIEALIKILKDLNPDVIGMSVQSMSFWDCADLTKEIKKNFRVPVIWGGIQPIIDPIRCLKYAYIIIRGEAEESLIELAERIISKRSYNSVKNLWVKDKNGKIFKNDYRPLIQNLDSLPFPDYSDNV
ncbi:MAG: cobalamin-dependent protein [Nanoarchaeota archaeon]